MRERERGWWGVGGGGLAGNEQRFMMHITFTNMNSAFAATKYYDVACRNAFHSMFPSDLNCFRVTAKGRHKIALGTTRADELNLRVFTRWAAWQFQGPVSYSGLQINGGLLVEIRPLVKLLGKITMCMQPSDAVKFGRNGRDSTWKLSSALLPERRTFTINPTHNSNTERPRPRRDPPHHPLFFFFRSFSFLSFFVRGPLLSLCLALSFSCELNNPLQFNMFMTYIYRMQYNHSLHISVSVRACVRACVCV